MPRLDPLRILVIEDDADTRANLRDILELDEYRVDEAASVADALGRDDWAEISAIILDRKLPDGIAEDLLPQLKAHCPEAAVLIVTGFRDLEGAIDCLRRGASDYILKPLNAEALRASLKRIADQRRLSLAKQRSDAAFRNLVEAAECMIVILRGDGAILYFSPFAEELSGYSAHEVLGHSCDSWLRPKSYQASLFDSLDSVLAGKSLRGIENPVCCRDGSLRWLLWNARRLDDYEGQAAVLAIGQDITAHKRSEQRALQVERLAAIGQMVTGLAHESRNALQRSSACLELLELEVADRPEALDLVQRVHKAQHHLHHLYEEVRNYAAPINLAREAVDVGDLWRETWSSLALLCRGRQFQLHERTDGINLRVQADPFALGQVFRNILENAIAACPDPGEIDIQCQESPLDSRPALAISFGDNGSGLNQEQRQKIFDPFYTTKTKGTGLGMAIAKRVVEAHGGKIVAGEGRNRGAEIVVTLPRDGR